MTSDGESWKNEVLCDAYDLELTESKQLVAKYGNTLYGIHDAEAVLLTDEYKSGRVYTISSDMHTLVWTDGSTIWRVNSPGAETESIAEDASGNAQISLTDGIVYYIDNSYTLCTISEDGEKGTLAEDVTSFSFIMR